MMIKINKAIAIAASAAAGILVAGCNNNGSSSAQYGATNSVSVSMPTNNAPADSVTMPTMTNGVGTNRQPVRP